MTKGNKAEQWLAIRKEAGRQIDPETAEVMWQYMRDGGPLRRLPDLPEEYEQYWAGVLRPFSRERCVGLVY